MSRREFLKNSLLGGVGSISLMLGEKQSVAAKEQRVTEDELNNTVSAATMLAIFSNLPWKLPNKLKETQQKKEIEESIYTQFENRFNELVDLAKQLKITCSSTSKSDPRMRELFELSDASKENFEIYKKTTYENKNIVYLYLTALTVASQQIARTVNEILPATELFDQQTNQIICKMLEKINQLKIIKQNLDAAREEFNSSFSSFTKTIGSLNTTIRSASEDAAQFERGEKSNHDAITKIDDAQNILRELDNKSSYEIQSPHGVKPQTLIDILEIPKDTLNNKIPRSLAYLRKDLGSTSFQNVSFDISEKAIDVASTEIASILRRHLTPTDRYTIGILKMACWAILWRYGDPPRENLIYNALQQLFWVNGNFSAATNEIINVKIR